jgi:hypothetical protein
MKYYYFAMNTLRISLPETQTDKEESNWHPIDESSWQVDNFPY